MEKITCIDWHCRSCGYEHESDKPSYSYPVKCPSCGKEDISRGYRVLPTNRVWRDSTPKQYDILGGNKQIQVYLQAATGEHCGITLDPDNVPDINDNSDPIEIAEDILERINRYIYFGGKERVINTINAMKECVDLDTINYRVNKKNKARKDLVCALYEYNLAKLDLADENHKS